MVGNTQKFKSLVAQVQQNQTLRTRIDQSIQWYKDCIQKYSKKTPKVTKKTDPSTSKQTPTSTEEDTDAVLMAGEGTFGVGNIYSFAYDPKYAQSLKYYDVFPLSLIVGFTSGGFIGLNFHYLSPIDRAAFMDLLYPYLGMNEEDQQLQINISYSILASRSDLSYHKPCLKKYLYTHVRSEPRIVRPHEWDITLFLPTEQFVKATKEEVWQDSKRKMK